MFAKSILLATAFLSFQAAAVYQVNYECSRNILNFSQTEYFHVSVFADTSDRKHKKYFFSVEDSPWVKVEKRYKKKYSPTTLDVPLWDEESVQFKVQDRILAGGYFGRIYVKEAGALWSKGYYCEVDVDHHKDAPTEW